MGGRGASSGGSVGGRFRSVSDFENSLSGFDDARLQEYNEAYTSESDYNSGLRNNIGRSIDEDGYTNATETALRAEEKATRTELNNLPRNKTPKQLGQEEALKERLNIIKGLRNRKGESGRGRGSINIIS